MTRDVRFRPKANIQRRWRYVRFVPIADTGIIRSPRRRGLRRNHSKHVPTAAGTSNLVDDFSRTYCGCEAVCERAFMTSELCVPDGHRRSLDDWHRSLDNPQVLVGAGLLGLAFLFLVAQLAG